MGLSRKSNSNSSSSSSEGWGMGFLLVFFPDEEEDISKEKPTHNFNLFSNSCSSILPLSSALNSAHLLHKAQSAISICLLLLFTTLLLFTLSTIPSSSSSSSYTTSRRRGLSSIQSPSNLHALQGMGTLYTRGTRAMNNLIVAHAVESLTLREFKLFLRLLHRSGLTSTSDLLFVFPTKTPKAFDKAIMQENNSFFKLLTQYTEILKNNNLSSSHKSSFDVTQFVKLDKESGEPIWGRRRIRANFSDTESSYGSVVGFDVEELDPENSLSGFLDSVPMSLRRWACYPMLLGRVRRNLKHVMLVDMKDILLLGDDQLVRVRSQSPESVLLSRKHHGKKNSEPNRVNSGIITGGLRGVRRLSNAMLTDIVRATMQQQHKRKNSVTESGLLNQIVGNEFVLKNVNLIVSTESVPELDSVIGANLKTGSRLFSSNHSVIRRGNSNLDVDSVVIKHICSFPLDSKVYSECN